MELNFLNQNRWIFYVTEETEYLKTLIILSVCRNKDFDTVATHLLESGTDLSYIQELLGYKSSRTNEIYKHVSIKSLKNKKNPINDFEL